MLLFSLDPDSALAPALAADLDETLAPLEERRFEDGELKLRPLVGPRGDDCYVLAGLHGGPVLSPHDKLFRLLSFVATLRDHGAARVTAVVPYLAYARKDRITKPFDPLTLRTVAQLLEAVGTDQLVVLEAHNVAALQNAWRRPLLHLESHPLFDDAARRAAAEGPLVVASPDPGGVKRALLWRERLEGLLARPVGFARQRKILEEIRFYSESRKDARADLLTGNLEDDWKLCQKWGINELSLKLTQEFRNKDVLAEATGMGSRENLRKATKVVQAIDLFNEVGRRLEAELLRETLNNSVHQAILKLRELEGSEAHYLYLGEEIKGSKGVLSRGDLCSPGTIKLKDGDSQAIVCDNTGESFFVNWTDLELVGFELRKNTPPKSPKPKPSPTPAPAVPVGKAPNITHQAPNITSEPAPPAFAVGDKVWLIYRERGGIIERVQWADTHRSWLYHFRYLDSDKVDSLLEEHFEPWADQDQDAFEVHNWITSRGSIGVVIATEPIKVQWMGMGTDPAPRGDIQEGVEELKLFDLDPFHPPKQALTGFKVGDVVSAKADKDCIKQGTLTGRDDYGDWKINWGDTQGQSWKDHQIHLAANCGFAMGDWVSFQWEGEMFAGKIVSIFRCVADIVVGESRRARVPFEWLNKLPKFCRKDAIKAIEGYVAKNPHPSGILTLVVGFAPHGNKEALKHVCEVLKGLNLPYCGVDSPYFMDLIEVFAEVLAQYEMPIDLMAIESESELIQALKGLSAAERVHEVMP